MTKSAPKGEAEKASKTNADKLKSNEKQERLAEALRANLRRRKTQNRERS